MKKYLLFSVFILMFSGNNYIYAGLRSKVNSGNRYYNKQNYNMAFEKYRDALISDPESKQLHFNLGNSFYRKENYEEAMKKYEKSTYSRDIKLQSRSYYNIGNCSYRMNKLPEAIQFYKKALELNPEDEDAKYNIEFVQKKLKENADKQQQQNQQKQQQKEQEQDKSKEKKQKQQQQQEEKEGMSKEEAERLLKAFEENEKEAQKKKQMAVPAQTGVMFDW